MRLPIALCTLLFAAACGGSSPATVTTTPAEPAAVGDVHCPMDVPGTSVTVEDLPAGAAMVFVTTGDAAALKARIVPFVEAHNAHHAAMGDLPTGDEPAPEVAASIIITTRGWTWAARTAPTVALRPAR